MRNTFKSWHFSYFSCALSLKQAFLILILVISHSSCITIYCYFTLESLTVKLFFIIDKLVLG